MADVNTARLCAEIIHTHFGPLTGQVVSTLLTRGRLPLPQIVHYSQLKPRIVRASILVLVQHNLLWHARNNGGAEVFEVNVDECFMRLRLGKIVFLARQLFGNVGEEIVQIVLDHGKLRLPDILSLLGVYEQKAIAVYRGAAHKLVTGTYLKPSTILSHVSPKDKQIKYEAEEKARISGFPTAKELKEVKQVAEARLKREEEEAEKAGLKHKAVVEQQVHRSRKRKIEEVDDISIDETVYFRVNFDKFNVHIRNELIVDAAKKRYNNEAATVLRALLKITENSQRNVSEVRSGKSILDVGHDLALRDSPDPMSVANIVMQLSEEDGLARGLILDEKKPSNATCIKEYLGMLSCGDNPTPAGKAASFVSFNSSKVQVEFDIVGRRLRRHVLESVTKEKHGNEGVRILRLLMGTGKMDDKQISKIVMMAGKDVRSLLTALATDSLISTQEVPKSADRNPTRTFYLWYVDQHKAFSTILGQVCKSLYNISMRRRAEREVPEVKAVLEKRERSDVRQDESLLTRLERELVKEWEGKLEKLTALEMRVEETLFILKDLGVLGIEDD
ncbi:DNA-directed RNA polymerase III subunit RPC3 [Leucoagaricus sp. SymC.cos]|nr:DNA-directed RNA polymerase III subunit RPC3 [Leucoagaricus sp. SymC.cos]